jgi:GNAT superfamily N-acetyltransferase
VADIVIRSAQSGDIPRIVELLTLGSLTADKEDPLLLDHYRQALAEIQTTPDCDVLVADDAGSVLGVCQLIVFRHFQARGGRCGELESLHVHPDHRNRGIGGQLLEAAVVRAQAAGCYRVQLTSNQVRSDAHRFYLRHGFQPSHHGFKRVVAVSES